MDQPEFDRVAESFTALHGEFAPLFGRKEAQRRSEQYPRGLLVQQTDRRNAENVAESIEGVDVRAADVIVQANDHLVLAACRPALFLHRHGGLPPGPTLLGRAPHCYPQRRDGWS
jgi:hypothetical protein